MLFFSCLPLLTSLRLPKWLYNSPVLTNLPFLPALDLGHLCSAGGVEGVCHTKAKCEGLGLTQAGTCTQLKSVCCTGELPYTLRIIQLELLFFFLHPEVSSCNSSLKSPVSYLTSLHHPVSTCHARVEISSNTCYLR